MKIKYDLDITGDIRLGLLNAENFSHLKEYMD